MENTDKEYEQLKQYFRELCEQIKLIDLLGKDLIYLYSDSSKYHPDIYDSQLLGRLIESLKRDFSLRFIMFLCSKEHFNIISFVKRLLINHRKANWNRNITKKELQDIEKYVAVITTSNEYETLKHLRDKIYAHNDKNARYKQLRTTIEEVMKYVKFLKKLTHEIGLKVFGINDPMEFHNIDIDHNLLSTLSNYHEVLDNFLNIKYENEELSANWRKIEKWIKKY